jgi:long-chain acyl-CoA synthetase
VSELNFGRILRQARRHGERAAIIDLENGHRASYTEHLGRIARLCDALAQLSISPTDRFAVLAGNSHAYIELWRAALAGAGMINPLNNRLAPDEIVYILNDSGSEVVFVDSTYLQTVAALRERVPKLRKIVLIGEPGKDASHDLEFEELVANASNSELPPEPAEDAPCVLMYTGGTTGLPKGVELDQRAVVLLIHRFLIEYRLQPGERHLGFMPLFHIGGCTSWGAIVPGGGCCVVMPAFEAGAVNSAIRDHAITLTGTVPTMLALMLQHPNFEPSMLTSLRMVLYGAAPMPPTLMEKLMQLFPQLGFGQAYGMTECSAIATVLSAEDHRRGGKRLGSVGRAAIGVEIDIRDADGRALPANEIGEIYVRCDSLMTRYWNKPEQTAASLIDGWYRSGDAGRLDEDGYLFLADRVKDMIVTGGENVYSLEVENAIASHPAVSQVAVVGIPHEVWGEAVHAVVVCEPGSVRADELDAHARRSIGGFKLPKSWTLQAEPLPLSAAGKVLKRELRERFEAEPASS